MRLNRDGATMATLVKERFAAAMDYPGTPRPAARGNDANAYLEKLMARQPSLPSDEANTTRTIPREGPQDERT